MEHDPNNHYQPSFCPPIMNGNCAALSSDLVGSFDDYRKYEDLEFDLACGSDAGVVMFNLYKTYRVLPEFPTLFLQEIATTLKALFWLLDCSPSVAYARTISSLSFWCGKSWFRMCIL